LSSEQRVELDERLDDLEANPHDSLLWEKVRSKILAEL
jgi:putative addiction module component (TIGR02574 family)